MRLSHRSVAFLLLVSLDYLLSALIFGRTGITVSARCYEAMQRPQPGIAEASLRLLGHALEWAQPGHCEDAVRSDILRAFQSIDMLRAYLIPPDEPGSHHMPEGQQHGPTQ